MKIIEPTRLFLTWHVSGIPEHKYVVASIDWARHEKKWTLTYLKDTEDYQCAVLQQFDGYPSFPTTKILHTTKVIDIFMYRLFPGSGKFYDELLAKHGLSINMNLSNVAILAYTGALLRSDTFELCADFMWDDKTRTIKRG